MNTENDHDYFNCDYVRETKKSFLVVLKMGNSEHWIPKSLCKLECSNGATPYILEVEKWFADQEGMHKK